MVRKDHNTMEQQRRLTLTPDYTHYCSARPIVRRKFGHPNTPSVGEPPARERNVARRISYSNSHRDSIQLVERIAAQLGGANINSLGVGTNFPKLSSSSITFWV